MIEVVKPGLETAIQDWPGRVGFWNKGFPPSGPVDNWSFRLANVLVGNTPGAAGLEAQLLGPTLKFTEDTVVAVTGADMKPMLDDAPFPMWQSVAVKTGQVLALGAARTGARGYVAFAGGLDTPVTMGSRATFVKAGVGGIDGGALKAGQVLPLGPAFPTPGLLVPVPARPVIRTDKHWDVEVCAGPNDDWIDEAGQERFLATDWVLSAKSDRTGYRLDGPEWTFTRKAVEKLPENGSLPANIIDQGYPFGAVNLAGQTPIILMSDGPSMGGFINPYTVPSVGFCKLAQARPGDRIRFRLVSISEAQHLAADLTRLCVSDTLIPAS